MEKAFFGATILVLLHRDKGLFNAPVTFFDDVADALTTLEVPALAVLAEEVELDVGLFKIWLRLLTLSVRLLYFELDKLAQLASLDTRLRLNVLHLQRVGGHLLALVWQQKELSVHLREVPVLRQLSQLFIRG